MAGAPVGNQNAARAKLWRAAINRALDKRTKAKGLEALDELAEKLLAQCDEGEISALRELGDRLDGKPSQTIDGDLTVRHGLADVLGSLGSAANNP